MTLRNPLAAPSAKIRRPRLSPARLARLVEEATIDCYNESEEVTGLFTMLEDNLELPFDTSVLGVEVTVTGIDLTTEGTILALCKRERKRQAIPILELPLPEPPPRGWEWIDAYRRWARRE